MPENLDFRTRPAVLKRNTLAKLIELGDKSQIFSTPVSSLGAFTQSPTKNDRCLTVRTQGFV
jgi:hypothetical protein